MLRVQTSPRASAAAPALGASRWMGPAAPPKAATARLAPLTTVFVISLAAPTALSLQLGDVVLFPYRVVGIIAAFYIALQLAGASRIRWRLPDTVVLAYCSWTVLSYVLSADAGKATQSAGVSVLETLVPYLLARVTIRGFDPFLKVYHVVYLVVLVLLPFALIEAVSHNNLIQESVLGHVVSFREKNIRFGLLRTTGPFDHPILYGLFCAPQLAIAWYLYRGGERIRRIAVLGTSLFLSLSSGPFVSALIQFALIGWDRLTARLAKRWLILGSILLAGFVAILLFAHRSPISLVIAYLSFDQNSGWSRVLQWNIAWPQVEANWIFGLGAREWRHPRWLPDSLDSHWLVQAVSFGYPGLILFAASVVMTLARVGQAPLQSQQFSAARKAWMISIIAVAVASSSVDFWKSMNAYFFFLLGTGMWLAEIGRAPPSGSDAG